MNREKKVKTIMYSLYSILAVQAAKRFWAVLIYAPAA